MSATPNPPSLDVELDHFFILSSVGAKEEAETLMAAGLREGKPNTHPGQGTACRRFFIRNAYLELLWVENPDEANSAVVAPTHLCERWNHRHTHCPFGILFRPSATAKSPAPPFPSWDYRPSYLPNSWSIAIGTNAGILAEPFVGFLPFAQQRPEKNAAPSPLVEAPLKFRDLTNFEIHLPQVPTLSAAIAAISRIHPIRLHQCGEHLLVLGFNGEGLGQYANLRPKLPLVFRW